MIYVDAHYFGSIIGWPFRARTALHTVVAQRLFNNGLHIIVCNNVSVKI